MTEVLKVENLKEGVTILTLNRPEVLNSLNKELVDSLLEAFNEIYEDSSIRSVIITGEGRGFCSGADLAGGGWPHDPKWSPGKSTANAMEIEIYIYIFRDYYVAMEYFLENFNISNEDLVNIFDEINDELKEKALEYAIKLANGSITGLKAIVRAHDNALKNTLNEQLDYERDTQRILCDGDVFKEGVTAFIEKRKPNFRDIE